MKLRSKLTGTIALVVVCLLLTVGSTFALMSSQQSLQLSAAVKPIDLEVYQDEVLITDAQAIYSLDQTLDLTVKNHSDFPVQFVLYLDYPESLARMTIDLDTPQIQDSFPATDYYSLPVEAGAEFELSLSSVLPEGETDIPVTLLRYVVLYENQNPAEYLNNTISSESNDNSSLPAVSENSSADSTSSVSSSETASDASSSQASSNEETSSEEVPAQSDTASETPDNVQSKSETPANGLEE